MIIVIISSFSPCHSCQQRRIIVINHLCSTFFPLQGWFCHCLLPPPPPCFCFNFTPCTDCMGRIGDYIRLRWDLGGSLVCVCFIIARSRIANVLLSCQSHGPCLFRVAGLHFLPCCPKKVVGFLEVSEFGREKGTIEQKLLFDVWLLFLYLFIF